MHTVPVVRSGRAVGGGPDQRVRELHAPAQLEQPAVPGRARRREVDPERPCGTVQQDRVAEGFCGSGEDEQLGVGREQLEAPDVALLDPAGDRLAAGKTEPACEAGHVPRARQLEQGERVAVTLLDDLVANGGIQRAGHVGQQQRTSIAVAEPADRTTRAARRERHRRSPSARRTRPRSARRAGGGRRTPESAPRPGRATARRRRYRPAAAARRPRRPASAWPAPPGTGPAQRRRCGRTPTRARRAAGRAADRDDPAWARRADAARHRPAPSPIRRRRLARRASRRPGRTGSPAARSCPRPPRPAAR